MLQCVPAIVNRFRVFRVVRGFASRTTTNHTNHEYKHEVRKLLFTSPGHAKLRVAYFGRSKTRKQIFQIL